MKNKTKKLLYYLSWIIGLIAVAALAYGIIRALLILSLIGLLASIFVNVTSIIIRNK